MKDCSTETPVNQVKDCKFVKELECIGACTKGPKRTMAASEHCQLRRPKRINFLNQRRIRWTDRDHSPFLYAFHHRCGQRNK